MFISEISLNDKILLKKVDELLIKFAAYMDEVIRLRNRILRDTGFDFFKVSKTISSAYIRQADEDFNKK